MNDGKNIGQRFIDMLYTREDTDIEVSDNVSLKEQKLFNRSQAKKKQENQKEETKTLAENNEPEKKVDFPKTKEAREFLYNKKVNEEKPPVKPTPSSFIFIEEAKHAPKVEKEVKKEPYRMRPKLSPMFGILDNGQNETKVSMAGSNPKGYTSYLNTVISPIYGVNPVNDLSNSMNLTIEKVEKVYEPFVIEEEKEPVIEKKDENDILEDSDNVFISEEIEKEFADSENDTGKEDDKENLSLEMSKAHPAIDRDIASSLIKEERGYSDTGEIDLFEDLFGEDK